MLTRAAWLTCLYGSFREIIKCVPERNVLCSVQLLHKNLGLKRNTRQVKHCCRRRMEGAKAGECNVVPAEQLRDTEATERSSKRKHDTDEAPSNRRGKKRRGKQLKPGERYVPPPQKRNLGVSFNQEHFSETSYYFEGGLRKVHPYYFDFKTYCKGRWVGKSLLEVFSSEFRGEPVEYYKKAVKEGRIRLNEIPVDDLNITLKNNDFMRNTVHRHEPPVSAQPLKILVDDGDVVVVDKPASLPVHPCGRYRHNTVIFILGKENGLCELHTVHRLDRLTSGVLLFARTLTTSKKLDQMVRDRQLEKEYVCRVEGEFPDNEVVCEEPILVVSFKVGLCRVDPKGKDCRTVFQKLSYNGRSSVVRCLPLTGRTHQIRVHLQFLGFPILNDPIYGSYVWGPTRGKGGLMEKNDQELLEALIEEHRSNESLHFLDVSDEVISEKSEPPVEAKNSVPVNSDHQSVSTASKEDSAALETSLATQDCALQVCITSNSNKDETQVVRSAEGDFQDQGSDTTTNVTTALRDHLCAECKITRPDPTDKELLMYLHALRYKGPTFEYATQLPDWAKNNWVQD